MDTTLNTVDITMSLFNNPEEEKRSNIWKQILNDVCVPFQLNILLISWTKSINTRVLFQTNQPLRAWSLSAHTPNRRELITNYATTQS